MKKIYSLKHSIFLCLFLVSCGGVFAQISNVHVEYSCPCRVTVTYDLSVELCDDILLYYSPDTVSIGWLLAKKIPGKKSAGTYTEVWDCEAAGEIFGLYYYKLVPAPNFVTINGVRWATRNVDAPGTFATCPQDYGMYYKWDSRIGWSGWSLTDPTMTSSPCCYTWVDATYSTATAWQSVNNPCPMGFRVPTVTEIDALVNTTYVTNVWISDWSENGYRFTDTGADGRGNAGNSIFIPAAGFLSANSGGLLTQIRTTGEYWSSTQNNATTAYNLYFLSTTAPYRNYHIKTYGLSVRCVVQ